VDACTVTAFDAITAFAVPYPNESSQSPSVFSGSGARRIASPDEPLSLLRISNFLFSPTLSTVDAAILIKGCEMSTPKTGANERRFPPRVTIRNHCENAAHVSVAFEQSGFSTDFSSEVDGARDALASTKRNILTEREACRIVRGAHVWSDRPR
jgi:hypothetical protein